MNDLLRLFNKFDDTRRQGTTRKDAL